MADKTLGAVKAIAMVIGMIAICASPIIAVTLATHNGSEAKATAQKALNLAEQNARDFAFFKGEVTAKLDNLTKGQDRVLDFVSKLERSD